MTSEKETPEECDCLDGCEQCEDSTCPDCGGEMTWCSCCQMYTQNCCVEYGTCPCN